MSSFQVWDSHYKDKTVVRPSYLYDGDTYTWKDGLYTETRSRWVGGRSLLLNLLLFFRFCRCGLFLQGRGGIVALEAHHHVAERHGPRLRVCSSSEQQCTPVRSPTGGGGATRWQSALRHVAMSPGSAALRALTATRPQPGRQFIDGHDILN